MTKEKLYDLSERTQKYASAVRDFLRLCPKDLINAEDIKQLTRSSGSIGANYIEANEALRKKDFLTRLRICRKEAKETIYWLGLVQSANKEKTDELIKEANELTAIFGSIITKNE